MRLFYLHIFFRNRDALMVSVEWHARLRRSPLSSWVIGLKDRVDYIRWRRANVAGSNAGSTCPLQKRYAILKLLRSRKLDLVVETGTFLGYIGFGFLADRFSRKYTYIGFLIVAALLVPLFAFVRNPNALLVIGPLVGFFGTGYFSGFSVIVSELFPTALRASAMGFVYNIGRVLSAAAPYLIGLVSAHAGLSWALCITSAAFLVAALIATALRPPVTQAIA